MLNMNYKKALLAATVLTAFCANAAFAGDAPDKPTMRERVDRILHCEDQAECPEYRHHKPGKHHRHQLTEEQIKAREARREAWKKMTPEQRKEAIQKWRAEHKKRVEAKMNKLTPEQRQEVEDFIKKDREFHKEQREEMRKHRQDQREELRDMTKEQREAIRAQQPPKFGKHHRAPHHKGFRHMPPMEKAAK